MEFKLIIFCLLIQLITADDITTDLKYPKNEFTLQNNTILSTATVSNPIPSTITVNQFDSKDVKKDIKKEEILIKDIQNENLKLQIKETLSKDIKKESVPQKDNIVKQYIQRDNSKATSSKDEKSKINKDNLMNTINSIPKEQNKDQFNKDQLNKDKSHKNQSIKDQSNKDKLQKDPPISPTDELADLFISTIGIPIGSKASEFRTPPTNNSKQLNSTSTFDDLKIKVLSEVHNKAKIFFQALTGNNLLREGTNMFKNKNDGLNKLNSIYSSTPYFKPFQASARPPSNTWCSSLSSSFAQYSQLNAFLVAAFLLFPVVVPFYLFGYIILALTRGLFCIGAKQIVTNIIYRIRSS